MRNQELACPSAAMGVRPETRGLVLELCKYSELGVLTHRKPQAGWGRSDSVRSHPEALTGAGLGARALGFPWLFLGPPRPSRCNLQTMTMVENALASMFFRNEISPSYVAKYKLKLEKETEREETEGETEERKELMRNQKSKGDEQAEHRGCARQRKSSVWHRTGSYVTRHECMCHTHTITTPRVHPNVKHGHWVIMTWQCRSV